MAGHEPPWSGGELDAFIESYREHQRRVHRLCLAYLRNAAAAEDATQETFIRAAPRLARMEDRAARRYLLLVARGTCVDELRRRSALGAAQARLGWLDQPLDPAVSVEDSATVRAVWDRLDERERVLFMYRFAGYSYEEISARLRISGSAVGMALLRARRRVRDLLQGAGGALAAAAFRRGARTRPGLRRSRIRQAARGLRWVRRPSSRLLVLLVSAGVGSGIGFAASHAPEATPSSKTGGVEVAAGSVGHPGASSVVTDLAVSPAYARDRTLFAAGYLSAGCRTASCPTLHTSRDGGHTWTALAAAGFAGGRIMLPPAFPRDERIFAAGVRGLQLSVDGGRSFRVVAGIPGPATVVPTGRGAGARIVIGATPLWTYDLASGRLDASATPPPGMVAVEDVRSTGDGAVMVAGTRIDAAHPDGSLREVARCDATSCQPVLAVRSDVPLQLASAPGSAGVMAAWSRAALYVSADAGRSFRAARTGGGRIVAAVVEPAGSGGVVATLVATAGDSAVSLLTVDAAGRLRAALRTQPIAGHAGWLVQAGERLVAGMAELDAADTALQCSADGGRRWGAC